METYYYYQLRDYGEVYRAEKREDALKRIYDHFRQHPYSKSSVTLLYWNGKKTSKSVSVSIVSVAGEKVIAYFPKGYASPLRVVKSDGRLGKKIGIRWYKNDAGMVTQSRYYYMKG